MSNEPVGENLSGIQIPKAQGDKTIKCWNCESLLMVKEEWNVVQCPTCEKVCKIPEDKTKELSIIVISTILI